MTAPGGTVFNNSFRTSRPLLAFMVNFMEKGREAVWPSDWAGRRGWYLFEDKAPADLEQQIERVLNHLDTEQLNKKWDEYHGAQ